MMSIDMLKEIAKRQGTDCIIQFGYDDGGSLYFVEPEDVFNPDNFLKVGDVEVIKVRGKFMNKKTGMRDIEGTVYRTVDDIRCITCINNIKDKDNLDRLTLYNL